MEEFTRGEFEDMGYFQGDVFFVRGDGNDIPSFVEENATFDTLVCTIRQVLEETYGQWA